MTVFWCFLTSGRPKNGGNLPPTNQQNNNKPTTSQNMTHASNPLNQPHQLFHCTLCNITCNHEISYSQHLNGKAHKKRVKIGDERIHYSPSTHDDAGESDQCSKKWDRDWLRQLLLRHAGNHPNMPLDLVEKALVVVRGVRLYVLLHLSKFCMIVITVVLL